MTTKFFLVVIIVSLAVTDIASENYYGLYRICCNTREKGAKCMEAYPSNDVISLEDKSTSQDQKWKLTAIGTDYYKISCKTASNGTLFMQAFPEVQLVKMKQDQDTAKQKFFIIPFSPGSDVLRIIVNVDALGLESLQAYPTDNVVKLKETSMNQNQQWVITRW